MKIQTIQNSNYIYTPKQMKNILHSKDVVSFGQNTLNVDDKKFAADCAIFAYNSYPETVKESLPKGYSDISSQCPLNPNSQIKAAVFHNPEKNIIAISYSGTYDVIDGARNAGSLLFHKVRTTFDEALEYERTIRKKYPNAKIVAVGHSAGGAMAQYVAAKDDLHAVTFASAGIGKFKNQLNINDSDYPKIVNYTGKRDFVVNPFYENIGKEYEVPVKSHSMRGYLKTAIYDKRFLVDPLLGGKVTVPDVVVEFGYQLKKTALDIAGEIFNKKFLKKF